MLTLNDLNKYSSNKNIVFKKETLPDGRHVTVVCYQALSTKEWEPAILDKNFLEIRGAVFDEDGICICRPFEKFFNVNQVPWVSWDHLSDFEVFDCQDKKDGTLINPVLLLSGEILLKSKKSHYSEAAQSANKDAPENVLNFCKKMCSMGFTPSFEYLAPRWKVVIDYGAEPQFILLAIRNIQSGEYLTTEQCLNLSKEFSVRYDPPVQLTKKQLIEDVSDKQNIEGYVITSKNWRAKVKTLWYIHKHYSETDLRFRDVADAVIDESFDDLLAVIISQKQEELAKELLKIEESVQQQLGAIREDVSNKLLEVSGISDMKEVYEKVKDSPLQKIILRLRRGAAIEDLEQDIKKCWKSLYRETYPLIAIVNSSF